MASIRIAFLLLLTYGLLYLVSCNPVSGTEPESFVSPFFKVDTFFSEELARIHQMDQVQKTTRINGEEETRLLDTIDLAADFRIFRDADINRPAWVDSYRSDTLYENDGKTLSETSYTALDPDLKTREIKIFWEDGKVKDIRIRKRLKSPIAETSQRLEYRPAEGYRIMARQKVVLAEDNVMEVEVQW